MCVLKIILCIYVLFKILIDPNKDDNINNYNNLSCLPGVSLLATGDKNRRCYRNERFTAVY